MDKARLNRYCSIKNEYKNIQQRRLELYSRATSTVGTLSGSSGGSGISDKTAIAAAIADYDILLAGWEVELHKELFNLESYIRTAEDPVVRILLRYKYVDGLSWTGVAMRYQSLTGEIRDKSWCWRRVTTYLYNKC